MQEETRKPVKLVMDQQPSSSLPNNVDILVMFYTSDMYKGTGAPQISVIYQNFINFIKGVFVLFF